jgi:hypothetical protein
LANDALDSVDQFKGAVLGAFQRLRGLAPTTIQDGAGRSNTCRRRRVGMPHHRNKNIERASRVASRQRADFGNGFGHLELGFPCINSVE